MELWCGKLCFLTFVICSTIVSSVSSALQLSDCKEFKVIQPENYDRQPSSSDDITKRPLGYMFAIAKFPGVESANLKNPCTYMKNLTSRNVEIMIQTRVAGKPICVRDNASQPKVVCGESALDTNCWNPSQDTMIYEFYCDTGKGCDTDVQFWYRLTPSPYGETDVDRWCNERSSLFPQDLLTGAPPPVERKPTVKSTASGVISWNICLIFPLLEFMYLFSL